VLIACLLVAFATTVPQAQQPTTTIGGIVVDAQSNAPIADAKVMLLEAKKTARTGPDGRFEFVGLPPQQYTLTVSTIGYIFVRRKIQPGSNVTVPLAEGTGTYQEEVNVSSEAATRPKAIGVSSQMELGSAALAELRGVVADDPMRAMQSLPGVATGDDFQAEFSVRGSAFHHVGVVMEGTPTPLLVHTISGANDSGSIAMINSDTLSRGALFGGPHARPHGDWLGATLEFDAREGSRDRAGLRAAISGTSASTVLEGPIGRSHRGSWLVSLRKSYIDWLIRKLEPNVDNTIGFSDAQLKVVYDLTSRQQVQLFGVLGAAKYQELQTSVANGLQTARSRSRLASLAWRYVHPKSILTQRVSFIRSSFENRGMVGQHLADGVANAFVWRGDVVVPLSRGWTLDGGGRFESSDSSETLRNFQQIGPSAVRLRFERSTAADPATTGAWAQAAFRGTKSAIAAGFRASHRSTGQQVFQPWLLAEYTLGASLVRGGIGRSAQYVDPIISALSPTPLVPEQATSYDLGIERPLWCGVRAQITGFYRNEDNILRRSGQDRVDPVSGTRIFETPFPVFTNTLSGSSRGADFLLIRRAASGLTGWISYTWAHTRYHDNATGEDFDGDFDQRHTFNVFLQQRLSYRLAVSGKLRVGSNFPIVGYFEGTPDAMRLSSVRNQVRLPTYVRLDLRANRTFTFSRSRLTLFAEVMNVLGRENGGQTDGFITANRAAIGYVQSLLPRIPSAGLLFEF